MRVFAIILGLVIGFGCSSDEFGVEKIYPGLGVTRGGEKVTIHGSGFDKETAITVYFGDARAKYTAIKGSDQLWVDTPQVDDPGKVDVRLIIGDGTQYLMQNGFEYVKQNKMAECVNIGRALNGNLED